MKISYSHNCEPFKRNFMAKIMSYSHDLEKNKNPSHKPNVLFNENPVYKCWTWPISRKIEKCSDHRSVGPCSDELPSVFEPFAHLFRLFALATSICLIFIIAATLTCSAISSTVF